MFAVFAPTRTERRTEDHTHREKQTEEDTEGHTESGSATAQTVMVRMLALREGAVYNVSTLTGSVEYTATTLANGIAVPINGGGEGMLVRRNYPSPTTSSYKTEKAACPLSSPPPPHARTQRERRGGERERERERERESDRETEEQRERERERETE